jgi:hypothetical protein
MIPARYWEILGVKNVGIFFLIVVMIDTIDENAIVLAQMGAGHI